jgi:hypothetical protein
VLMIYLIVDNLQPTSGSLFLSSAKQPIPPFSL